MCCLKAIICGAFILMKTNPIRVFLMRHAETSVPGVFHGAESDIGLSDRGIEQAKAAARFFSKPQANQANFFRYAKGANYCFRNSFRMQP